MQIPEPKTGSSSTGLSKLEQAQQSSLLDYSFSTPQTPIEIPLDDPHLVVEKGSTEQNQDNVIAIGQVAQSLAVATQFREDNRSSRNNNRSSEKTLKAMRDVRRTVWEQTGYIPPIAGGSEIIGKAGFRWKRELSEDGRKLYSLLLGEIGDVDLLPIYANKYGFDLNAALNELRKHEVLDESNPRHIRIIRDTL